MLLLNAQQHKNWDLFTIKHNPITSYLLIQQAALACLKYLIKEFSNQTVFHLYCGMGNNGADGLALAKLLHQQSYKVYVYIVAHKTTWSDDAFKYYDELKLTSIPIDTIKDIADLKGSHQNDMVIDAIIGAGYQKKSSFIESVIQYINQNSANTIAIDIPTGMTYGANNLLTSQNCIKATQTITFETPKLAFYLPCSAAFAGKINIVKIGLHPSYLENLKPNFSIINHKIIQSFIKKREKFSHKGTYGHATVVAGSYGKIGAALLASKACLKSGVGLVTAIIPSCGITAFQTALPEVMVNTKGKKFLKKSINIQNTIGIGPGLGTHPKTAVFLEALLSNHHQPMVIDADAINIIAQNPSLLHKIPSKSILTPHPKELERLIGSFKNDIEKIEKTTSFCKQYQCIIIIKDAYTLICDAGENWYVNKTGNPGMATAGSGDVLTGIITGLLTQTNNPIQAAIVGVYIHGLSGDIAVKKTSEPALVASDLIKHLGKAYLAIEKH